MVKMKWIGADPHPRIDASEQAPGYFTYLAGHTDAELHTIVTQGSRRVTYHDLYPGIDVEYSFPAEGGMKYNLIVHPGADLTQVQMEYSGPIKKLNKDKAGNLSIVTQTGDLLEHAPVSYTADGHVVTSSYDIHGAWVSFALPDGYDHSQTLTVDPWVTTLTQLVVKNLGTSVDYDFAENLYVYGCGSLSISDITNFEKVAKFDVNGTFQWVFMGSVASVSWSSASSGLYNYMSSAIVDKVSNKIYVGEGFNTNGARVVRLTAAGLYDNFVSIANPQRNEIWSMLSDCSSGSVLALGGSTSYYYNVGIVDAVTGTISTASFTGVTATYFQDIVSGTYDAGGNFYCILASLSSATVNNVIYRVDASLNSNVWSTPSGYLPFMESNNLPTYAFDQENHFNALAANGSYLYYYDGLHLKAFNLTTGATVGTPYTIAGYTALNEGGIAVDNCNHIYVGGMGVIKTFTFNGSTFTPGADIPLGAGFGSDPILDLRYDPTANLLFAAGSQVVGTYNATQSIGCNVVNAFTHTLVPTCNQASVHVVPDPSLINPNFTYIWRNSADSIIRQTVAGTQLNDTLRGVGNGDYTLWIQLNSYCNGAITVDSFTVSCGGLTVSPDTTICAGQSVTLRATGTPAGGAYLWTPGGATTSSITLTPASDTMFSVKYTTLSGLIFIDTIHVFVVHSTTVTVRDTTICSGQSTTLTATPLVGGGTYLWSPGGATTQRITVSPTTTSTYTVAYTTSQCGAAMDSATVTVVTQTSVSVPDTTICTGRSATLTATPSVGGGTYLWSPGGATTQSITVSPASSTTYTVSYNTAVCGTAVDSGTVTVTSAPTVSVASTSICLGQSTTLTAIAAPTGGTYLWSPTGATTQSITVSPASVSTYTVSYSLTGCNTAVGSVTVSIYPPILISLHTDSVSCTGLSDGTITSTVSPSNNYTYLWSNNSVSTYNDPNIGPGTYYLTVTDPNGCTATESAIVSSPAAASLGILPSDTTVLQGDTVNINSVFGVYPASSTRSYTWTPSSGLSCGTCPNPVFATNLNTDTFNVFTLTVMYNNGCVVTQNDTVHVELEGKAAVPDAFSPNGDGKNETYKILAHGVNTFFMNIYNRWGQLVFESKDITKGWDGTYKGTPQPDGVYVVYFGIAYQNGKSENRNASLTLLR